MSNHHRPVIKPSLTAGILGLANWFKSPVKAWHTEKEQWTRYWSYRKLSRLGLIDVFKKRPADAIPPKYHHLYGLYRIALQRKPEIMLELGGGCSTFLMAQAAHDLSQEGHPAALYSVDQSEYWQQTVRDAMPEHLRPFVHYHLSDVEEANGVAAWRYQSLPVEAANFVYVDGGSTADTEAAWADAYFLERDAPMDYAISVDGRKSTCAFLSENLEREYSQVSVLGTNQTLFRPR